MGSVAKRQTKLKWCQRETSSSWSKMASRTIPRMISRISTTMQASWQAMLRNRRMWSQVHLRLRAVGPGDDHTRNSVRGVRRRAGSASAASCHKQMEQRIVVSTRGPGTRSCTRRRFMGPKEKEWVTKVEKNRKKDAEELWKQLVLKVEALCPSLGERKFRPRFDFVQHVFEYETRSGIRCKFVARFMSWNQYKAFATGQNGMTLQQATAEWVLMESTSNWPSRPRPDGTKTYLVHLWDEVEGFHEQSQANKLTMSSKQGKIGNEDDVEAMKASLKGGHEGLTDDWFGGSPAGDMAASAQK